MQTLQLDNGILNNYATEPEMYLASFPAPEQQQRYLFQAGLATLFVTALTFVAIAVS
jgi:hypothetical protein